LDVVVCPVDRTSDFSLVERPRHWPQIEVFVNNEYLYFDPRCPGHYRRNSLTSVGRPPPSDFRCPNLRGTRVARVPPQPAQVDLRRYVSLNVRQFGVVIERTTRRRDLHSHFERLRCAAASEAELT